MEEELKCKRCGARFTADNVDDALQAEELACPNCGYLFAKNDLGPRDWLHKPIDIDDFTVRIAFFAAVIVILTIVDAPFVAMAVGLTILAGALCAYWMRASRKRDERLSIVPRKDRN